MDSQSQLLMQLGRETRSRPVSRITTSENILFSKSVKQRIALRHGWQLSGARRPPSVPTNYRAFLTMSPLAEVLQSYVASDDPTWECRRVLGVEVCCKLSGLRFFTVTLPLAVG